MQSHFVNMLITSLILSACLHAIYYDKLRHRWHHHFWLYFGFLFCGSIVLAWVMYLTEPPGYY